MCLLIARLPNAVVPVDHLYVAFGANPDGAGIAYAENGEVKIVKGFMEFADFIDAYRAVPAECPALIHFRWSTHGTIDRKNCHPFRLPNGGAMAHNGIIDIPTTGDRSDTRTFVNEILAPAIRRDPMAARRDDYQRLIEKFIGGGSKLAFLDVDGEITLYNEKAGHWDGSVWYSNCSYKYTPKYVPAKPAAKGAADYGAGDWWISRAAKRLSQGIRVKADHSAYTHGGTRSTNRWRDTLEPVPTGMEDAREFVDTDAGIIDVTADVAEANGFTAEDFAEIEYADAVARLDELSAMDHDHMTDDQWCEFSELCDFVNDYEKAQKAREAAEFERAESAAEDAEADRIIAEAKARVASGNAVAEAVARCSLTAPVDAGGPPCGYEPVDDGHDGGGVVRGFIGVGL